jgi:hypothetical protein
VFVLAVNYATKLIILQVQKWEAKHILHIDLDIVRLDCSCSQFAGGFMGEVLFQHND